MVLCVRDYQYLDIKIPCGLILSLFISLNTFFVTTASALDEERLWLPSNYERLYLELKKSALTAQKLERCETILRGTIDLDASTKENPVFRILCRQPDGRTYNEMVDGKTGKTLTTELVLPELMSEEEKQRLAKENEKKHADALLNSQKTMWQMCDEQLTEQTKLFDGLVRLHEFTAPLTFKFDEVTADFVVVLPEAVYQMDFDALDMYGKKLEYRAKCYVENQVITKMKIRKRREIMKKDALGIE